MISVGMIGTGNISNVHAKAIYTLEGLELKAAADIALDRARSYEERYQARAYTDYKEMVEKEKLDAVVINLPHGLHKEAAVYCARKGLHILLEKPMANNTKECDAMIEAASQNGVKLMIGHVQRYIVQNLAAKKLIGSGELGDIVMISDVRSIDYFTGQRPQWFFDKKLSGGGIVMNYGAHSIDKFMYLTGKKVTGLTAAMAQYYPKYEIEGNAQMLIRMEGNITAVVSYSSYKVPAMNETTIFMTGGVIKLRTGTGLSVSCGEEFQEVETNEKENMSFIRMWNDFKQHILNDTEPVTNGEYGREVIRWIEEAYRQTETV